MVLLGGTTTGKTFHFGPDGVLLRGLRDALGEGAVRSWFRPVLSVEVSPVPGGRGSTVSIDFYGAEVDLYPRREYIGWLDLPGQDYLVGCPVYKRIAEEGAQRPRAPGSLLDQLLKPGRPEDIVKALRDALTEVYGGGLLPGDVLGMGFYEAYADISPGSEALATRIESHLESLERALRDLQPLEEGASAWALLTGAVFHLVRSLAADTRRDLERRGLGSRLFLESLKLETVIAGTLARAYLERATRAGFRSLFPASLEHDTRAVKACVGPGCPGGSWPHRLIAGEVERRVYSMATSLLLEHQALIAGLVASLLQLELAERTGLHAVTQPVDTAYPAARYLERNISMRGGPQALERVRAAVREWIREGCGDASKPLDTIRGAAVESVPPLRVIQSLAGRECPASARVSPRRVLEELAGAMCEAGEKAEEGAREILETLAKHYTYTGPLGDLLASHTRSIGYIWRLTRRRLEAVLVVLTFTDLALQRTSLEPEELATRTRSALVSGRPPELEGLNPFPLEPPPGGFTGKLAVVPGGEYPCCQSGKCNPALTLGYLASLMAVISE